MPFRGGTFLEVGAWDGESNSNTYFFEWALDWSGVLIEMRKEFFPLIHLKRPLSRCINCALGPKHSERLYLNAGDRSCLLAFMRAHNLEEIEQLFIDRKSQITTSWIDMIPLMEILDETGVDKIDYFSLDVEGAEMEILRSIDFTRLHVNLFSIEDVMHGGREILSLLGPLGYEMLPGHLAVDQFFVRTDFIEQVLKKKPAGYLEAIRERLARPLPDKSPSVESDICSKIVTIPAPRNEPCNIALHRPARQSSLSQWSRPNDAAGAVSGTPTGGFGFHTKKELDPWWEVDLEVVAEIVEIRIHNRLDANPQRASTILVRTSLDGAEWQLIHDQRGEHFGGDGRPLRILLRYHPARFIRIQLFGEDYLHLDQVQVYGRAVTTA